MLILIVKLNVSGLDLVEKLDGFGPGKRGEIIILSFYEYFFPRPVATSCQFELNSID